MKRQAPIQPGPCKHCKSNLHTSIMCFKKPRKRIKPKRDKTKQRELETRGAWLQANPGDVSRGTWKCYLQIHEWCPVYLDIVHLTLEHVEPKGSHLKRKYDLDNLLPACAFCNVLKGSRSLKSLCKEFPHLIPIYERFYNTSYQEN